MAIGGNIITLTKYNFCWSCGNKFNSEDIKKRKTFHHAIPKMFKPKYNIKIPICQECHYRINPINQDLQRKFLIKLKKKLELFFNEPNGSMAETKVTLVNNKNKKII